MSKSSTNRRDFLKASLVTSAVFGAESALTTTTTRAASANGGKPKNIIFMVSDGMNHGALALSRQFHLRSGMAETHWTRLYREKPVVRALVETFSASSVVTDSAAAASAWGGGQRVNNGVLNVLPDGKHVKTIQQKLQEAKMKVGLVSTATITHATPAGFAVNMDKRGDESQIAEQYLDRRVDVLLGGGKKFFSEDLKKRYAAAGYAILEERKDLEKLPVEANKPVLGTFNDSHMSYSIDRENIPEISAVQPTLAEMTKAALARLSLASDGFFLLVEGARIDHTGHANDAAASVHEQYAFDQAIGVAADFAEKHPDTLVIISTDHGCGGIQMNGVSAKKSEVEIFGPGSYNASNGYFDRLKGFNRSIEWMKQNNVNGLSGKALRDAIKQYTGLTLTDEQLVAAQGLKAPNFKDVIQEHIGIGFTSGNHTGELVEFCAFGAGSSAFPAFMKNEEEHDIILRLLEVA